MVSTASHSMPNSPEGLSFQIIWLERSSCLSFVSESGGGVEYRLADKLLLAANPLRLFAGSMTPFAVSRHHNAEHCLYRVLII